MRGPIVAAPRSRRSSVDVYKTFALPSASHEVPGQWYVSGMSEAAGHFDASAAITTRSLITAN